MGIDATKADNDAVLLLENLRIEGYQSADRSRGFDSTFTFKILEVKFSL